MYKKVWKYLVQTKHFFRRGGSPLPARKVSRSAGSKNSVQVKARGVSGPCRILAMNRHTHLSPHAHGRSPMRKLGGRKYEAS